MSWDVALHDKDDNLLNSAKTIQEGGTQVLGGTDECHLNVTYNYSPLFPFGTLNKMLAGTSLPLLDAFIAQYGNCLQYPDYWAPTPGNVVYAVKILHGWAVEHPDGVWNVS